MKHTNIATTLGWAEVPDTAEGFYLQPEEASTIDAALGTVTQNKNALEAANVTISEHVATIEQLQNEATEAANTNTTQAAEITRLNAEVLRLGKESSGPGSNLKSTRDEASEEVVREKPRYDSEDHPANRYAKTMEKFNHGKKK